MKKAFTLAEVMIVLVVIGVLTAVLLPAARNAMPKEDVIKFKKGHNTLLSVVRELVTSDKYYLDGDLGIRTNGQVLNQSNEDNHSYLISTFADILSLNYMSPKVGSLTNVAWFPTYDYDCYGNTISQELDTCSGQEVTKDTIDFIKAHINTACKKGSVDQVKQVVTNDGIWFWDPAPYFTLGMTENPNGTGRRAFHLKDKNGFYALYKLFCMDIDGVPDSATDDDCVNECPFSYGISADGKIFTSKRVDEWLEKSIQEKD
ncbi:MAG: type II secretion system protein [Candidatus Gastranaerophilales bacterium]|nr:type II secretion system protein [Candidatus Gastranaerophilales bacterium]